MLERARASRVSTVGPEAGVLERARASRVSTVGPEACQGQSCFHCRARSVPGPVVFPLSGQKQAC